MKIAIVLCILAAVALASAGETYTDRFDNVDVPEILNNHRLLVAHLNCVLDDKAKCTAEGRELKSNIKDALENYCKKCTKYQEMWSRKVIAHLINHEPEYWQKLVAKYDPERKYITKYEDELKTLKGQH